MRFSINLLQTISIPFLNMKCALAMESCDSNGPLVIYISRMAQMHEYGKTVRMYAFGRVYSGKLSVGDKV
jgi:elongation factor 2